MPKFGDIFTYEYSHELVGGRRFYNCVLLKDLYTKTTGTRIDAIFIDPPNHMWLNGDDRFIFRLKSVSLRQVQSEVFDMFINDLSLLNFEISRRIEDKYGTILSYRMHMYIGEYMNALFDELTRSVRVIKHHWKRVISNPSYKMCKKRLLREFGALKNLTD